MVNWASIAQQVANIGVNLLTSFLGSPSGSAPQGQSYPMGDILWSLDSNGHVTAYNQGTSEQGISLAMNNANSNGSFSATTLYQPIPHGQSVVVPLSSFTSGSVCLGQASEAPDAAQASPDALATVTFAISFLVIAVAVKVINGLMLTVGTDPATGNYQISLVSTGPVLQNANVTVTDGFGNTVSTSATFQTPPPNNTYAFDLPKGINCSPIVESLNLGLSMDNASYLRATADNRKNCMQGPPKKLHLAGARP